MNSVCFSEVSGQANIMGVDIVSYRSRIGCFRHNSGTDVVTITVDVHFSKAATYASFFAFIILLLAFQIYNQKPNVTEYNRTHAITFLDVFVLAVGTCILRQPSFKDFKKSDSITNTRGSVVFIGMLLLLAGIEPNPGPNSGRKGHDSEVIDINQL